MSEHLSSMKHTRLNFLRNMKIVFADSLLASLPPVRPEDHRIDLIPRSSPPHQPPYHVNLSQQEEIMTQVNDLLEKGLIRPSSSPYCSPVLLVKIRKKHIECA